MKGSRKGSEGRGTGHVCISSMRTALEVEVDLIGRADNRVGPVYVGYTERCLHSGPVIS